MKNNIDIVKNLIKILDKTCENNNSESARAIENVLSELKQKNEELDVERKLTEYNNMIIKELKSELETYKKIAERYERECKMFRAFCRRIRKNEKRNVDEFNQGREYAYIQFLNLISGEQNWGHEGKYFDEVDKELLDWARKEVEK